MKHRCSQVPLHGRHRLPYRAHQTESVILVILIGIPDVIHIIVRNYRNNAFASRLFLSIIVEYSRTPQFMTFLSLIKSGIITYDWRGYTSKTGKYSGKNHGNAWRIKPNAKAELFGEIEKVEL